MKICMAQLSVVNVPTESLNNFANSVFNARIPSQHFSDEVTDHTFWVFVLLQ